MAGCTTTVDEGHLGAIRSGSLTEAQARAFVEQGPSEVIIFTLLALAQSSTGAGRVSDRRIGHEKVRTGRPKRTK